MKGATQGLRLGRQIVRVSIRAPREGGDLVIGWISWRLVVSIRAPREGGDAFALVEYLEDLVSIRAPREGGD